MAKGFKFGLQKVLEIRAEKEEESKRRFSASLKERDITKLKLESMQNDYEKHKGIKPGENITYQKIKRNYLLALETGISNSKDELRVKEEELEYRRRELKEKRIERKTVETLKDKKYIAFLKENERVERMVNDELALYSYIRKNERG